MKRYVRLEIETNDYGDECRDCDKAVFTGELYKCPFGEWVEGSNDSFDLRKQECKDAGKSYDELLTLAGDAIVAKMHRKATAAIARDKRKDLDVEKVINSIFGWNRKDNE